MNEAAVTATAFRRQASGGGATSAVALIATARPRRRSPAGTRRRETIRRRAWQTTSGRRRRSGAARSEANLHVGFLRHVDAVDEADAVRLVLHDHGAGPRAVAEEADAAHQRAVGDAGRCEDDAVAGREIFRAVDLVEGGNPPRPAALLVSRFADDEPGEDLAVQTAHGRRGEHPFGRAAGAHHRVHAGADDRRRDAGREVAVANQADAGAGLADVVDQLLVPRPI